MCEQSSVLSVINFLETHRRDCHCNLFSKVSASCDAVVVLQPAILLFNSWWINTIFHCQCQIHPCVSESFVQQIMENNSKNYYHLLSGLLRNLNTFVRSYINRSHFTPYALPMTNRWCWLKLVAYESTEMNPQKRSW